MRREEAVRMGEWIRGLALPGGAVCLNIGSSTESFRRQAHIEQLIFAPLRGAGVQVIHCDLKEDPGVDLVGDILDPDFQAKLRTMQAQLLICSNLLEHLTDPRGFTSACGSLVAKNGYALFSVPRDYPFHPDPIDTMFRPSPTELAAMLPGWAIVEAEEVACGSLLRDLTDSNRSWRSAAHYILRLATPFYRPYYWLSYMHRLLWMFRDYKVTLLLAKRIA